jgi:hypothetical protein
MDDIDGLTDGHDRFIFSDTYSRLEYYKCFNDPSSVELISGVELMELEKQDDWSEEQRKIWLYFYRPYKYGNVIGGKQKKIISKKESIISNLTEKTNNYSNLKILCFVLTLLFFYLSLTSISFFVPIITLLSSIYFYLEEKSLLIKIFDLKNHIKILNKEINYLFQQQNEMTKYRVTPYGINRLFWKYLRKLENEYIDKLFHENKDNIEDSTPDFYKYVKQKSRENHHKYPNFPVIPSWALLQQSQKLNPNTHESQSTGLKIASKEIDKKIATWRRSIYKKPIFRLWYIQFLFFHEKNLTIQSFYYDFITRKKYGEHLEVYQYNHITNYSYMDEDISYMKSDLLIKKVGIPDKLTNNIFCDQVKTLSFSSASGSNYRCVIPDNDVIKGLNEWLKSDEAKKKLKINNKNSSEESDIKEDNIISQNEKEELLKIIDEYEGLIATLAWQSFKELRDKVAQFALTEDLYNKET